MSKLFQEALYNLRIYLIHFYTFALDLWILFRVMEENTDERKREKKETLI